jgi:cytochrome b6-f complex iron-sulfur subunit
MNRRDLVQKIVVGGAVLVFAPSILKSCTKDPGPDPATNPDKKPSPGSKINLDLTLAENSILNSAGGSLVVQNILVVNKGDGSFAALSSICTHQGCTVGYDSGASDIKCPCHGSVYAITGSVINGPAPTALKSYPVSKTGDVLTISF